ncbi:hypothetical protein [Schlesneria sp.]|uniref:hypothetical protein n=1 Tax=Schlesneria sp. TaxID=2762018 RepID=UPI002F00DF8B
MSEIQAAYWLSRRSLGMRYIARLVCWAAVIIAAGVGNAFGDGDAIEASLIAAKEKYEAEFEAAQAGILEMLNARAASEQAVGDLKAIEVTQAEIVAFEERAEFPPSLNSKAKKAFDSRCRIAAAKLEQAYEAAIKQYTKEGNLAVAKAIREEREEFSKPSEFQKFEGHWFVRFKNVVHTYKIARDGEVKFGEKTYDRTGQLYRNNGDVLLKYEEGKLERFTIVRGKLIVFHYHPEGLYAADKPPSDRGEGTLIK